ncbi:recombinase family protein [Catenulispora sp. NL8]|uniref:Recombinase family protein n=1 Tax=Catenulispora pinistramenti TaxID=2705254 RepID=A0ABS5KW88_9ACTN|nr:recombinase family protein [Catenulispora pinistramenti]MBS2550318.1 recombinase family protein [Catenulispora pinistramenti]
MEQDGMTLPVTPYDGCGKCLVAVRRLSRWTDATSSPERQARQDIEAVDGINGHIIGWADDWEVSGAVNPLNRPALGPWLRDEMGPYDGIIGPDVSRIGRNMRDSLNTCWLMEESGKLLVTADHGIWDLTDPAQENQFTALAWGAQMELRAIQKRNSDAAENARASGRPRNKNSYGYRFVRLVPTGKVDHVAIDPVAAKVIREVARRILDDESGQITVNTEAARLNREGVLSPKDHRAVMYGRESEGTPWGSKMLKSILTSPAALGYLMHQNKPVLRPDGHPVQLADPLWDDAMRKALIKKTAPKRKPNRAPRGVRLLAGRAFCGTCDERLYVGVSQRGDGNELRYLCNGRSRGLPKCEHCKPAPSMAAAKLERIVEEKFLGNWGSTPLLRREFDPGTGYATRIAELEGDRERLERDRAAGLYDRPADEARYYENHKRMSAEIDDLSALPERPASVDWVPTGQRVADQWQAAADDAERREILATYGVKVILYPNDGTHGDRVVVHGFDEDAESDVRQAIADYEAEQAAIDDDADWATGAEERRR